MEQFNKFGNRIKTAPTRKLHFHSYKNDFNKQTNDLELVRVLQKQIERETMPWVQDLLEPLLQGEPQPLPDIVPVGALADLDSKFALVNGICVHYKEKCPPTSSSQSSPPVLVLMHGYNGSTFQWRYVMESLSELNIGLKGGCRVIAMDRPPFGLTERPSQWQTKHNPYSNAGAAELTAGLLDVLGIKKCIPIGHSAGASVAVQMAIDYRDRVDELVLVSPGVFSADRAYRNFGEQLRSLYILFLMQQDGPAINYVRRFVNKRIDQLKSGKGFPFLSEKGVDMSSEEYLEGYLKPTKFEGWDRGLVEQVRSFNVRASFDFSKLSGLRTTVITGSQDEVTTVPFVTKFFDILVANGVQASYTEMDDCGHVPMETRPAELVEIIGSRLKGQKEKRTNEMQEKEQEDIEFSQVVNEFTR